MNIKQLKISHQLFIPGDVQEAFGLVPGGVV